MSIAIKQWLQGQLEAMAATDENFKARFEDEKKSLEECVQYIFQRAKEEAKNERCVGIEDKDVLGWAVHYYQEEDVKPTIRVQAEVSAVTAPPSGTAKVAKIKPTARKQKKADTAKAMELDLFGDF